MLTPTQEAAMRQALEALELIDKEFKKHGRQHWPEAVKARNTAPALRAALAEPVQEPVAWKDKTYESLHHQDFGNSIPLYAAPPQRKPLTDAEIADLWHQTAGFHHHFARAIERAHGIGERA